MEFIVGSPSLLYLFGLLSGVGLAALIWLVEQRRRKQRAVPHESRQFHAIFEHHPFSAYYLDTNRRFIDCNSKALDELEVTRAWLVGKPVDLFITPKQRKFTRKQWRLVLRGEPVSYNSINISSTGKRSAVQVVLIPRKHKDAVIAIYAVVENISERMRAQRELFESRQMLKSVLDLIPQRVYWKDAKSVFLGCNQPMAQDAGLAASEDIIGLTDYDLSSHQAADAFRAEDLAIMRDGKAKIAVESRRKRRDGEDRWVLASKIPMRDPDGDIVGILGVYDDITEQKALQDKLEHMAFHDSLTGLPNRVAFYSHLRHVIKKSKRRPVALAALYFDIDDFKDINDSYGHDVGDQVICLFAKRVRSVLREEDLIGRLGGDEFALLLEGIATWEQAEGVANKILNSLKTPLQVDNLELRLKSSIGIALYQEGMSDDRLINLADQAMYQAKRSGGSRFCHAERPRSFEQL